MDKAKRLAQPPNFSVAFEQMCSMVAIGKTKDTNETLSELMLHCLVYLPDDKLLSANDFVRSIEGLFGIKLLEHELQYAIDRLVKSKTLSIRPDGSYALPVSIRRSIQRNLDETYELETEIRDTWAREITEKYAILDFATIWKTLRAYLGKAFQRHGIQAVALLDPAVEISQEYSESLSAILGNVIDKEFPIEMRSIAQNAISGFMATTGNHPRRASYISQLADGAFNYYSLTIDPKIASDFRKNLSPLDLFFDTNFLFGILDLTVNPQVAVSNELLRAIDKYKLPFRFYSHQKTIAELLSSIDHYADVLGAKNWSRQISRAAATSRHLSGVELRYHQKYAAEGVDVDSFFKPYKHSDVLLKGKGIIPFNAQQNRTMERAALIAEYIEFLKKRKKEKIYELIDHDMTVLDLVRQKRTNAKSSLEAGALFITCDYSLYRFDWENSRANGKRASTVMPNIFWQILRTYPKIA